MVHMDSDAFLPQIDLGATGRSIERLIKLRDLTVRDIQKALALTAPQAVYKWLRGKSLPSVDHLYALSILLQTPVNEMLVVHDEKLGDYSLEQTGSLLSSKRGVCYQYLNVA
jgi:transcriptional regulator with XRE-family HTH domain